MATFIVRNAKSHIITALISDIIDDNNLLNSSNNQTKLKLLGDNGANTLKGSAGSDLLDGGGGNDLLIGNRGNDTLIGGLGSDTLIGGNGNDTYIIDNNNDRVTEAINAGKDTVQVNGNTINGINYNNVETLKVLNTHNTPLTIELNQLSHISLSNNADNITLHLNQNRNNASDLITISTAHGADTINLTPQISNNNPLLNVVYANHLNFTDLTADDKIDMSAFKISQVVTDSTVVYGDSDNGYYLVAPSAVIAIMPSPIQLSAYYLALSAYQQNPFILTPPTYPVSGFFQNTLTEDWQLVTIVGINHTPIDANLTLRGISDASHFLIA